MMTVAVAMGADFSGVLVWHFFADLVWYQLAFFNWDGVRYLDGYLMAHLSGFIVAFGFDDLTNGWFANSLWNNGTMWFLNLSGNLNWYLSANMLNINSTMGSWSGIALSFAWPSFWLSFAFVKTLTSECKTMWSLFGVIAIIFNWVWYWSWSNWSGGNG